MPEVEVTEATETVPEVTGESPEEPTATGSTTQDSTEQLTRLQAELQDYAQKWEQAAAQAAAAETRIEQERNAREEAEQRASREEKVRIGYQKSSTAKLQELAALKQQLANQTITNTQLDRMEKLVLKLAQNQFSPEDFEQIDRDIKTEQERRELERYRQESQTRSQGPQQQPGQAPELDDDWKIRLYNDYFSTFKDVDPLDLADEEWHQTGIRNQFDWYDKVRAEFEKRQTAFEAKQIAKVTANAKPDETAAKLAELEARFSAQREEDSKKLAETQAKLNEQQKELDEAKRLVEENQNRRKGMDREHESVSESASGAGSPQKALAKTPPTSWLYGTPEQKKAYRASMNDKNLRNQILGVSG